MRQSTSEKKIILPPIISIRALASKLNILPSEIISLLLRSGLPCTINEEIDFKTASFVAEEFGFRCEEEKESGRIKLPQVEEIYRQEKKDLKPRPPIVTVMGHVDHGKTSLLDAIRKTNVVAKESGGITQHIGAYQVEKKGKMITFIDTPGHEAFVAMRSRGAKVTDLMVLVVDASDGVRPQTIEAIKHARQASCPIIVALSKIDKPEADPERIKKELSEFDLIPEEWGGKTVFVSTSSVTGEGIDELLEMIILVGELAELKANPKGQTAGTIIESHLDPGKGPVATALIQNGTLKIGQPIVAGGIWGKVRSMENFLGKRVKEALPSMPVLISGLSSLPEVGDILYTASCEKEAKSIAASLAREEHIKRIETTLPVKKLEKEILEAEEKKDTPAKLKIILKTDVSSSLEVLDSSILALNTPEVETEIISEGIGEIGEGDIKMAAAFSAEVFGFRVGISRGAKKAAEGKRVKISFFNVIYELIDTIHKRLEGLLKPEIVEVKLGEVKILQIFRKDKGKMIVGGKVTRGKIENHAKVKVRRGTELIGEGKILNLQKDKKNTEEVKAASECGIEFSGESSLEVSDILEAFKAEEKERHL